MTVLSYILNAVCNIECIEFSMDNHYLSFLLHYSKHLRPQRALESLQLSISKVYHVSSAPSHRIVWLFQNMILFVSGMSIVQYDTISQKFKIIPRNHSQGEILIFKCLKRQFSNIIIGYITRVGNNRCQFLYKNHRGSWGVVSTFTLREEEAILDCMMLSANCFWVLVKTTAGRKLLIFRDHVEMEYQKQGDEMLYVFPSVRDQLIVVNKYSVETIRLDTYMFDIQVVRTVPIQLDEGVFKVQELQGTMLLFGYTQILVLKENIETEVVEIDHQISRLTSVEVMDEYVMLTQGNSITRLAFKQTFDSKRNANVHRLYNPVDLFFEDLECSFIAPKGRQVLIKLKHSSALEVFNIQTHHLHYNHPLVPNNYPLKLEGQSQSSIYSIQHIPTRLSQIFYLQEGQLYQNSVRVLTESVVCYSVSRNGLYVMVGFMHYLKGYYVGRNKLFLVESLPMLNIVDVKFCYGNKYVVLTKQQLKVYSGTPAQILHSWTLANINKYVSMEVDKRGQQAIAYERSGNIAIYCLVKCVKLKQIKPAKAKPIMYDFTNQILFSYSTQISICSLEPQMNVNLQYADSSVPTQAITVQQGGFIVIGTGSGSIRIHKWPPTKEFITAFIEFKVFSSQITALEFDDVNFVLYMGSETGTLSSIKMSFENSDMQYQKGIFVGFYIQSRRRELEHQIQVKELQEMVEQRRVKYTQEIMLTKCREEQDFQGDDCNIKRLQGQKIRLSDNIDRIRADLDNFSKQHQKRIDKIKEDNTQQLRRLRDLGVKYGQQIQQLKQACQMNCKLQRGIYCDAQLQQKVDNQKNRRYCRQTNFFKGLPLKMAPIYEKMEEEIQLHDHKILMSFAAQQLKQLQSKLEEQQDRHIQLLKTSCSLPDKIWSLNKKIMEFGQLSAKMLKQVESATGRSQPNLDLLMQRIRQLNVRVNELTKKEKFHQLVKKEKKIEQAAKRISTLESYNQEVVQEEIKVGNERYYKLLDQLKDQAERALMYEKQIREKQKTRQQLKDELKKHMEKNMQLNYQLENFKAEVLKKQESLGKQRSWRKRKNSRTQMKSQTIDNQFLGDQHEFQVKMLQRAQRSGNASIATKIQHNENLLAEQYRLKKQSISSEIYLRFLKSGLPQSQIQRIECKKPILRGALKPTLFQQYHQKRLISHKHTHSMPVSRRISQPKISSPLES